MRELDSRAAIKLKVLCSHCVYCRMPEDPSAHGTAGRVIDARVPSLGGNAGANSLGQFGLDFAALNVLQEHGLVIADYNSYMDWWFAVPLNNKVAVPLIYGGQRWALKPKDPQFDMSRELRVHGVALSFAGRELLSIIETQIDDTFTQALRNWLDKFGFEFVPV